MILLLLVFIAVVFYAAVLAIRSQREPAKRNFSYADGLETGLAAFGWVFGVGSLITMLILLGVSINGAENIPRLDAVEKIYLSRVGNLEAIFRTELLKYPEIEKALFDKITSKKWFLYATQYPEIQSSAMLRGLVEKTAGLYDRVYDVQVEKEAIRALLRKLQYWCFFLPKGD